MTRRQLAVPLVAALVGSAVTAATLTAAGGIDSSTARQAGLLPGVGGEERLSPYEIYERSAPSVVHVQARSAVQPVDSPFGGGAGPAPGIATGSGFVLDEEGLLVTSARVVSGVADLRVTFMNLRTVPASVVGKDEESDLAVLRVDPEGLDLRPLEFGDSDAVNTGDQAVAMGNPSGLQPTAGTGVISSEGRRIETPSGMVLRDVIETNAVIAPATSGGPLLDADGRVIGVSSGDRTGADGLGVAVPANAAQAVLTQLQERHKVIRPYLGLRGRTVEDARAAAAVEGERAPGVLVTNIYPDSPAEQAGLQGTDTGGGDVIEAIDGRPVASLHELLAEIAARRPGEAVTLRVLRDGSRGEISVRLTERPATVPAG
jgi:S1-C subfamily serine protease